MAEPRAEHVRNLIEILQRRSPERLVRLVKRGLQTASYAELSGIVDEVLADELIDRGMDASTVNEYGKHVDDLITTFNAMRIERESDSGQPDRG